MKVLILGAAGMLGHRLMLSLRDSGCSVVGTVRQVTEDLSRALGSSAPRLIAGVSAETPGAIEKILDDEKPDVVVNCIGVVKQLASAKDPLISVPINALLPHRLAKACAERGMRMIHFSTDCVFSGIAGPYTEASWPDARDLYGRSKLLGEVNALNVLTLRTSIIGHELGEGTGLVSWILRNKGKRVSGFAKALYTGVTTDFMGTAIYRIMTEFPELNGVWHFSADPISKYDLVCLTNQIFKLDMHIMRDEDFMCDRRLDSTLFRNRTRMIPPTWPEMIEKMQVA